MNINECLENYVNNLNEAARKKRIFLPLDEVPIDSGMNVDDLEESKKVYIFSSYIGDCITSVFGDSNEDEDDEYDEDDDDYDEDDDEYNESNFWDGTEMAQALWNSKYYPYTQNLLTDIKNDISDVPQELFSGQNYVCGVNEDKEIGFIYNVDTDMHYFFNIY